MSKKSLSTKRESVIEEMAKSNRGGKVRPAAPPSDEDEDEENEEDTEVIVSNEGRKRSSVKAPESDDDDGEAPKAKRPMAKARDTYSESDNDNDDNDDDDDAPVEATKRAPTKRNTVNKNEPIADAKKRGTAPAKAKATKEEKVVLVFGSNDETKKDIEYVIKETTNLLNNIRDEVNTEVDRIEALCKKKKD